MSFRNQFDFTSDATDIQKLTTAVVFMRTDREAGAGLAGWVHKMALPFNDPKRGALASKNFTTYVEKLVEEFISKQKELLGWELEDKDIKSLKLEGNSALAGAFKKVRGAMREGGDLITLDTASKCQSYVTKVNKEAREQQQSTKLRDQATELARDEAEKMGLEEGTDAFDQFVTKRVNEIVAPKGLDDNEDDHGDSRTKDEIDMAIDAINAIAHQCAAEGVPIKDIVQQLNSYKGKLENRIAALALTRSGVINSDNDQQEEQERKAG